MKTMKTTLKMVIQRLKDAGIEDAAFEAAELAAAATGRSKASLMTGEFEFEEIEEYVRRRIGGEPLQYILGQWEFMGCPLKVSSDCLIPRADTELIASLAIDALPQGGRFADLCTGSGCIAAALLVHRRDIRGTAVELYKDTLNIAAENIRLNGVSERLEIVCADVREDCLSGEYDVIVSNPPYVTKDEMKLLSPEVQREPRHALTDGGDGLSIIRKIVEIYPSHLKTDGRLFIEIGWQQGDALRRITAERELCCNIIKDAAGRDRVAEIYCND